MMENEVIIDGCNVAECEHLWKDNSVIDLNFCRINFDNNYFSNGIPCCDKCKKHPDCYFKQLQRTKAENAKLKKEVETWSYQAEKRDEIGDVWYDTALKYKQALEEIKNNCVEILATIAEEGKPNHSIVDTIWCKNIPCCTLWELVEGMQRKINEVLNERI